MLVHRFAKLVALATLLLIFVGGLVKSTETGLSDPTWPHFNGGYEPQLHGTTLYEHTHRLIAGTVALLTTALCLLAWRRERRAAVRALALAAVLAVFTQATFGGLTVLFQLKSLGVSLAHAGLAQAFLCLGTALAVVTAPSWTAHPSGGARDGAPRDRALAALAAVAFVAVYAQVLLGAWVRYTPGAAYAIPDFPLAHGRLWPELTNDPARVQFVHRVGAAVVTLLVLATAGTALARGRREPLLARPAALVLALLVAQVLLGGATIWSVRDVYWTTAHVATGAALLACSLALALRVARHARVDADAGAARASGGAPRVREAASLEPALAAAGGSSAAAPAPAPSLLADLATLGKARISLFVAIAAAVGFHLGSAGPLAWGALAAASLGAALLAASASALNQVVERDLDARMRRTASRPVPAGRLSAGAASAFGALLGLAGTAVLALSTNALTTLLGAATLVSYVAIYTPLKRLSWTSTIVGAVPGAMPPVLGWAAARGELSLEAWTLFAIVFFWQLPHFFAIAWLHREDYARGGFPVLAVVEPDGASTSRQVVIGGVALLGISLLPTAHGLTGPLYLGGAALLGALFLALSVALARTRTLPSARRVFVASLVYLPALLALMSLDKRA
jgi:protoheme IX farnesyltransferase